MVKNEIIESLIENVNLKLTGGYELNYDGIYLNLKRNNKQYCIYVSSNIHEVFDYLLVIDSFIYAMNELD